MALPSPTELRALFDEQVRKNTTPDGGGSSFTATKNFVRSAAEGELGWSEICWSRLDEDNADEIINEHISFFTNRGQSFVWRVFEHDSLNDLGARLEHAGFVREGHSTVLIGDAKELAGDVVLPNETTLLRVDDENGIELFVQTEEAVFGHDHDFLRTGLKYRMEIAPQEMESYVVLAGDTPISAGRIELLPNREFGFLWGGGTLPEWRGNGLYTALVRVRANIALKRGYSYLGIFASSESRPILTALGFVEIDGITRYAWKPSN